MYTKPISYSGMSLYAQCPKKWHNSYVLGNREPSGKAAERGTMLHDLLEKYFKGSPYPTGEKCLAKWESYMSALKARGLVAEGEIAVFQDWTPASFDDPTAWFRGKIDGEDPLDGDIYDWKSGKIYDDHEKQAKAYVAMRNGRRAKFVYLDIPHHVQEWNYSEGEVQDFKGEIDGIVTVISMDEEWVAKPGDKCCWCSLSWRNGGTCTSAP